MRPALFLLALLHSAPALAFFHWEPAVPVMEGVVNGYAPKQRSPLHQSTVLVASPDFNIYCSGTLIARDLVVTAGHCVTETDTNKPLPADSLIIDFSSYYDGESPLPRASSLSAKDFRLHAAYDHREIEKEGIARDVALIRLSGPLPPGYRPAAFLPRSQSVSVGDSVVAAGFGDRDFSKSSPDFRLLTFDFQVRAASTQVTLVKLAATRRGGIATGDSGGPAWLRVGSALYFWGVASGSDMEEDGEATYENLAHYREWLESSAASMGSYLKLP